MKWNQMNVERMKKENVKGAGTAVGEVPPEMKAELAKRYIKIPVKYTNVQTSDAKVLVTTGRSEHNFDLTD